MSGYTIVGGGAIGGTLAAYLARGGAEVTIVDADAAHVGAIRVGGLRIERADGSGFSVPLGASTPQEFEGELGAVILAVKAQATGAAMDFIAPRLADDGWVASVQNGLNEPLIAERIGAGRTVSSFVNIFADAVGPGVVLDGGLGALVFGEYDGPRGAYSGGSSERTLRLVEDLREWGGAPVVSDNVGGYLWSKLSFGAMLAATSVADVDMHRLIDTHRPTMHGVAEDVLRVAEARGISPEAFDAYDPQPYRPGGDGTERDAATDRLVAWLGGQGKKRSGIWRDIAVRHRATEMPAHYGPVLAEAERLGLRVPMLRAALAELADVENGAAMDEARLHKLDELNDGNERA